MKEAPVYHILFKYYITFSQALVKKYCLFPLFGLLHACTALSLLANFQRHRGKVKTPTDLLGEDGVQVLQGPTEK